MFALAGIAVFLACVFLVPGEWPDQVRHIAAPALALGVFGYAIDLRLRRLRPEGTPQLFWVAALLAAAVVGLLKHDPVQLKPVLVAAIPLLVLHLLIAHGVQSFRAFSALAALILAGTLWVSVVASEQGAAPRGCFKAEEGRLVWDGRGCTGQLDCERQEADYRCEHVGLLGTQSLEGRVRYLGWLGDPDQLALALAVALPFALAFFERKRSATRAMLAATATALTVACALFTRSRGGQLALLASLGVYGLGRLGARAWLGIFALALLLWRSGGGDAQLTSASVDQGWYPGLRLFGNAPLLGVGLGQFTEYHVGLPQNSFVLAAAELGLLGFVPWTVVLYLSLKIPLAGLRRLQEPVARTWALALLSAWCGLLPGLLFRASWRGELFWIFTGLSGAFYSSTRTHDPGFEVRLGWRELVGVVAADGLVLGALWLLARP